MRLFALLPVAVEICETLDSLGHELTKSDPQHNYLQALLTNMGPSCGCSGRSLCSAWCSALLSRFQGICVNGASKLKVSDTEESFIPDGSYLLDTNDAIDE